MSTLAGPTSDADANRLPPPSRWPRSVRRRLLALGVPWLVVVAIGLPLLWAEIDSAVQGPLRQDREETLRLSIDILKRTIDGLGRDVTLLADLAVQVPRTDLSPDSALATLFRSFARSARYYDQVRWIDDNGDEKLRVNMRDGPPTVVPGSRLQNKADRPYFKDAVGLPEQGVYVSALELNVESGVIERPFEPTLRMATPLFDDGRQHGVVIVNYRARRLLDRLAGLGPARGIEVYVLNQSGYWIRGPTPENDWAGQLGAPQRALSSTQPALWEAVSRSERGSFSDAEGDWAFARFDPATDGGRGGVGQHQFGDESGLYVLVRTAPQRGTLAAWRWQAVLLLLTSAALAIMVRYGMQLARSLLAEERRTRELHEANQALTDANERLRSVQAELVRAERLSSLGLMVAGVAHELNTPLGSANLSLSTVQHQLEGLEQQLESGLRKSELTRFVSGARDGLAMAETALRRSSGIVQRFKQVAVDRGTMERRRFDLAEIVLDADPWLRRRDPQNGVVLSLELAPHIEMDSYPGPLEQVVANLLANARAHAFGDRVDGRIDIRTSADGSAHVVLRLADNGVGIPDADLPKIFDPFFTTSRHAGGTGLGLHIVHQLVTDVLGGTLRVESRTAGDAPNRTTGTVFTLRLPRDAPRLKAAA